MIIQLNMIQKSFERVGNFDRIWVAYYQSEYNFVQRFFGCVPLFGTALGVLLSCYQFRQAEPIFLRFYVKFHA